MAKNQVALKSLKLSPKGLKNEKATTHSRYNHAFDISL